MSAETVSGGDTTLSWAFPASSSTVPRARRLVAAAVRACTRDEELAQDAALVVGELAANAVLHARTPYTVSLRVGPRGVHVEVGDASGDGVAPVVRGSAMTGRGIRLVDEIATAWGVRPRHGGKVVWADLAVDGPAVDGPGRRHVVRLLGTPVALWLRSIAYHDDLLREAALMADGVAQGTGTGRPLPDDLVALARALASTYSGVRAQDEGRAAAARAAGRDVVDVELTVPAEVTTALPRLTQLLDEASRWAAGSEYFLTPAPDPDVRRFRSWYLEEVVEQVGGRPPRPFPATADDAGADPGRSRSQRRLRLLAHVAGLVDTPMDLQVVLQRVAELAIEELADWCAVDLEPSDDEEAAQRDGAGPGGPPTLVAVAHKDPDMVALALELQHRYPPAAHDPERDRILRDLVPMHLPAVTDEMLVTGARDEQHLAILRSLGMSSAVAVPLQASGRAFGVMLLVATGGRTLDEDDVALAVELGRRAGTAVHKVRLAEQLRRAADELALSEARYRTLVQTSALAVWRAAPDGSTLTDMPAWRSVTGSPSTAGWAWLDDVHPDDAPRVRRDWLRSVATAEPYAATYRIRALAGGWRWVDSRAVPVRAPGGRPDGPVIEWIGSVSDATARVLARSQTEALLACAQSLAQTVDVPAVLASLRDVAAPAVGADRVAIALLAPDRPGVPVPHAGPADRTGGAGATLTVVGSREELRAHPVLAAAADTSRPRVEGSPATTAAVPLLYDARLVAAVELGWSEPQDVDEAYGVTLRAIAAQYAAALVRARLYEAERATSLTLQAALAPAVPRTVANVRAGVHYRPAGVDAQVGGDWADVIRLRGGRALLAVGDVMGSGIPAAATMGRLRTTLAALALHEDDPGRLLVDLDAFLHASPGEQLATLALVVVERDGRSLVLHSAGHLPALLVPPGAPARFLEPDRVPPLGVGWSTDASVPRGLVADLPDGAVLALFSDGLLETRDSHLDDRLELLRRLAQEQLPAPDLDAAATRLVETIRPATDDDVTLLLARVLSAP